MSDQLRVSLYMVTMLQCTQEHKVCNMDIKIVTLVVKGNANLGVSTNWQETIQVESRSVALCYVFYLKLRGYIWPGLFSKFGLFMDNMS